MSETFPETNTPVQTPSTESFVNKMNAGDKTIGNNIFSQNSDSNQQSSHQEPLSPPNPSPTPEKRQLDDGWIIVSSQRVRNKRWKKKLRPVKPGSSKLRSAKLCLKLNRQ